MRKILEFKNLSVSLTILIKIIENEIVNGKVSISYDNLAEVLYVVMGKTVATLKSDGSIEPLYKAKPSSEKYSIKAESVDRNLLLQEISRGTPLPIKAGLIEESVVREDLRKGMAIVLLSRNQVKVVCGEESAKEEGIEESITLYSNVEEDLFSRVEEKPKLVFSIFNPEDDLEVYLLKSKIVPPSK